MKKIICIILVMVLLSGCDLIPSRKKTAASAPGGTLPQAVEETVLAEPVYTPVMSPDGIPSNLGCKAVYEEGTPADGTVATMGQESLKLSQLQAWYSLIVNAWRKSDFQTKPDFSVPLWAQSYPKDGGHMSWEQFFLSRSLRTWVLSQSLIAASHQVQKADDPDFNPNIPLHNEHLREGYPVLKTMYGDKDSYEMPPMHTQWIENLSGTISDSALLEAARTINEAYSYYDALWEQSRRGLPGTFAQGKNVDLRQCLLLPEGGQVAADGTVTASEESWRSAMERGQELLTQWQKMYPTQHHPEATFAAMANQNSADSGTAVDGGGLNGVIPGQLIDVLDDWCFDESRQVGDYDCLRSEYGVILTYLCAITDEQTQQEQHSLVEEAMAQRLESLILKPLQVDYSAICLAPVADGPGLDDVLYPDVGHERYSYVPTYFQQDYYPVRYGPYTMEINGCGVTSLAMLSTFMKDEFTSPGALAKIYGEYSVAGGSNGDMYVQISPEQDFYLEQMASNWEIAREALAQGKMVISLQRNGYFTKSGHYILLAGLTEDGKVIVRDPSVSHYAKLKGFAEDCFEEARVYQGGSNYWIYQKKILTIPGCARCGDGETYAVAGDYLCRKCQTALPRRDSFCLTTVGLPGAK